MDRWMDGWMDGLPTAVSNEGGNVTNFSVKTHGLFMTIKVVKKVITNTKLDCYAVN